MGMSNYLKDSVLNHVFKNTAYVQPNALFIALYTTDPTNTDTGTELEGTYGYVRQSISFNTASNGSISNKGDVVFPISTGAWGTVKYIGIRDASTEGNLLYYGALTSPQDVLINNQLIIKNGELIISES